MSDETFTLKVKLPKKAQDMLENILLAKKRNENLEMNRIEWTYEKIEEEHVRMFGTDDPDGVRVMGSE